MNPLNKINTNDESAEKLPFLSPDIGWTEPYSNVGRASYSVLVQFNSLRKMKQ